MYVSAAEVEISDLLVFFLQLPSAPLPPFPSNASKFKHQEGHSRYYKVSLCSVFLCLCLWLQSLWFLSLLMAGSGCQSGCGVEGQWE